MVKINPTQLRAGCLPHLLVLLAHVLLVVHRNSNQQDVDNLGIWS